MLVVIAALPAFAAPETEPQPVGKAALVMDSDTGQVLYEKNATQRMYPASTTKIMTTLLALEKSSLDDLVVVSRRAAEIGGSRIGLQPGEQVQMKHLLYILMLSSANDAGIAIAEHVGGSVEDFARMMNDRARELGAKSTNFVNPHGMPDKNHYTTAMDLAVISRQAMQNTTFREIVMTLNYKADRKKNMSPELLAQVEKLESIYGPVQEDFYNHNKLLGNGYYSYSGANGIKTGYTVEAGQCIVASARRGGREMIAVVLNSQGANLWSDVAMLLDYGFDNFTPVALVKPREMITDAKVKHGAKNAVLETAGYFYYNFPVGEEPQVTRRVELVGNIQAPLEEGEKLGELVLTASGEELGRVPLVTVYPVSRDINSYWWFWAGAGLATLFLLCIVKAWFRSKRRSRLRIRRW
ncbi:D-alanyl-D-alanine carboxypeptidase family protein [Desulfallas thermosapovorans]|nr:D-alanyl-D-alanine carboxypeptidase family protein [Desulfallas thermosapovorans]